MWITFNSLSLQYGGTMLEVKNGVRYAWWNRATCGLLGYAYTPKGDQYRIWFFQTGIWSVHCREKDVRKEFTDVRDMEKFLEKN